MDRRLARRVVFVAGLLLLTLAIGTTGFHLIEGHSLFDAFYETLTIITTIGSEQPLSHAGKIFNSFLILFGVIAMFLSVGTITQTIIDMELRDPLNARRTKRMIDKLQDHFIVCGFGRVGRNAAFELQRAAVPFVVIDHSEQRVERAIAAGMAAIRADATRDESLREAGVEHARGFIAALATDADNVFVILSVKTLNPGLTVVTRAAEENSEEKLRRAGAGTVFSPYSIAGHRLAQALIRPHVVQLLDFAGEAIGLNVTMEQLRVPSDRASGPRRLSTLTPRESGLIVLAIGKADGRMIFNPDAEIDVSGGDVLIVMGEQPNLRSLENSLSGAR